jgi:sugar lactone lactonase YvrE
LTKGLFNVEKKTTVLTDALRFPEGTRWRGGKLWCCDPFVGKVVNIDLQGNVRTVIERPRATLMSLGWTPEGKLLIVSAYERQLLRLDDAGLVTVADLSSQLQYPLNDMVIDGQGRAYIGNINDDFTGEQAEPELTPIVLVTADGNMRTVADGLAFPNGMAITPDGKTLIAAESHAACLTAFTIGTDGSLSNRRVWAQFGDESTPDGISLDAEGAVWFASPGTSEVIRAREGGEITNRVAVSGHALACMLGGAERRTLFVATSESLDASDAGAKGRIEMLQVDVPGAGLP